MFYIIRRAQSDYSRVLCFIQDENENAVQFETEEEAEDFISGHVIEPLLEVIEIDWKIKKVMEDEIWIVTGLSDQKNYLNMA